MAAEDTLQRAEACYKEAQNHYAGGRTDRALEQLRQSILLYAAADAAPLPSGTDTTKFRWARADACRNLAARLTEAGHLAESANIYQEATDLYAQIGTEEAEEWSRDCARRLLENLGALNAQPQERLYLLVAHYERIQRQLELESESEVRQAECCVHIARIFQRRERPEAAIARFAEALRLYERVKPTAESELARAECHHRIATLLSLQMNDLYGAERHYRQAIDLYAAHEPVEYGFQSSLELCRAALLRIAPMLRRAVDPLNME